MKKTLMLTALVGISSISLASQTQQHTVQHPPAHTHTDQTTQQTTTHHDNASHFSEGPIMGMNNMPMPKAPPGMDQNTWAMMWMMMSSCCCMPMMNPQMLEQFGGSKPQPHDATTNVESHPQHTTVPVGPHPQHATTVHENVPPQPHRPHGTPQTIEVTPTHIPGEHPQHTTVPEGPHPQHSTTTHTGNHQPQHATTVHENVPPQPQRPHVPEKSDVPELPSRLPPQTDSIDNTIPPPPPPSSTGGGEVQPPKKTPLKRIQTQLSETPEGQASLKLGDVVTVDALQKQIAAMKKRRAQATVIGTNPPTPNTDNIVEKPTRAEDKFGPKQQGPGSNLPLGNASKSKVTYFAGATSNVPTGLQGENRVMFSDEASGKIRSTGTKEFVPQELKGKTGPDLQPGGYIKLTKEPSDQGTANTGQPQQLDDPNEVSRINLKKEISAGKKVLRLSSQNAQMPNNNLNQQLLNAAKNTAYATQNLLNATKSGQPQQIEETVGMPAPQNATITNPPSQPEEVEAKIVPTQNSDIARKKMKQALLSSAQGIATGIEGMSKSNQKNGDSSSTTN